MKLQVIFAIVLAIFTVHALGGETEVETETQSSVPSPLDSTEGGFGGSIRMSENQSNQIGEVKQLREKIAKIGVDF